MAPMAIRHWHGVGAPRGLPGAAGLAEPSSSKHRMESAMCWVRLGRRRVWEAQVVAGGAGGLGGLGCQVKESAASFGVFRTALPDGGRWGCGVLQVWGD